MTEFKICLACEESKLKSEFHKCAVKFDGLYPYCKSCRKTKASLDYQKHKKKRLNTVSFYRQQNIERIRLADIERAKKRKLADPEKEKRRKRGYQLNRNFGITIEQYEEILSEQGGGCAICGRTPEEEG